MISRTLFVFEASPIWRPVHAISAAISVMLLAVHVGLHGKMILNVVKTKIKLPIVKITAFAMLAVILTAGIYGDVVSKTQQTQNQITRGPQYDTALGLFDRIINFLTRSPEQARVRMAEAGNGSLERIRGQMPEAGRGSPEQARSQMAEQDGRSPERTRGQMPEAGSSSSERIRGQIPEAGSGSPEQARGRMMELGNFNGDMRRSHDFTFSLSSLLISVSNYLTFILVSSLMVFLIDNAIKKITQSLKTNSQKKFVSLLTAYC
jgi:hypothetical protein